MSRQSIRHRRETISVIDVASGERTVLLKITPVVTETLLDGSTHTFEKLATLTDRNGVHVNRSGQDEFLSLNGSRFKLI